MKIQIKNFLGIKGEIELKKLTIFTFRDLLKLVYFLEGNDRSLDRFKALYPNRGEKDFTITYQTGKETLQIRQRKRVLYAKPKKVSRTGQKVVMLPANRDVLLHSNFEFIIDLVLNNLQKWGIYLGDIWGELSKVYPIEDKHLQLLFKFLSGFQNGTIIIEEPELHLSPNEQMFVVEKIAETLKNPEISIILFTNSPYILTKLNNFIYAGDLVAQGFPKETISKVVPERYWINPEEVEAYALKIDSESKEILSIMGKDEPYLVSYEKLDAISDSILREFDSLLDVEFPSQ